MSEKKIVIPEGMISACRKAWRDTDGGFHDSREVSVVICEAALRWLSKRSPDMTQESIKRIADSIGINPIQAFDAIDLGVRRMFLAPESEVKFYSKVGDEYIEIQNPSEELKAMFNIPPGGGNTACVVTDKKSLVSENDICEIGAVLRDRNIRISNFEVGEILNIARQNVHSELPAFVSKKESEVPETEMIGQETINEFCSRYQRIGDAVIEAYRRGKESK